MSAPKLLALGVVDQFISYFSGRASRLAPGSQLRGEEMIVEAVDKIETRYNIINVSDVMNLYEYARRARMAVNRGLSTRDKFFPSQVPRVDRVRTDAGGNNGAFVILKYRDPVTSSTTRVPVYLSNLPGFDKEEIRQAAMKAHTPDFRVVSPKRFENNGQPILEDVIISALFRRD